MARAEDLLSAWIAEHPRGFPPIVLNLTDGEANDGDPVASARQLTQLRTDDGNVLLFNLHISDNGASPITFPADSSSLPNVYARTSSRCPANCHRTCANTQPNHYDVRDGSRGFVYNSDMGSLVQFLDIGTRALALR